MGKPYNKEVAKLASTYEWCRRVDVSALAAFIKSTSIMPMTFVGSGGSYAVAAFAAGLHELYAERLARPATALDIASTPAARTSGVLFISAGGRHPDVLGAFNSVARMEPLRLAVFCGNESSPLADLVRKFSGASYLPIPFPAGKDGFLATNSVLASVVLLLKAFWQANSLSLAIPGYEALDPTGTNVLLRGAAEHTSNIWSYPNFLVLYGPTGAAAALDFESRFHEAGLASVQLADFRNFAHGRHYWLARMKASTCVLVLCSPEDEDLATRTLALLPSDIARAHVNVNASGPLGSVGLLLLSIHMAGWAGRVKGIDPGQPRVPDFGRRIYHLSAWTRRGQKKEEESVAAIWRKSKRSRAVLQSLAEGREWERAHSEFVKDLASAKFLGIILDYDDTVCAPTERETRPGKAMANELNRLLGAGLWVGIATGRGKSAKKALRSIIERAFWTRVVVGYYNGAQVAFLSDSTMPAISKQNVPVGLQTFLSLVSAKKYLTNLITIEANAAQVKLEPIGSAHLSYVTRSVQHIVATSQLPLRVVVSSRSVDVIPLQTSKNAVIAAVRQACGSSTDLLCIGDSGEWPGNDFELLSNRHSLSADSTSPDPSTCWNLAPVGIRCVDATLRYLRALKLHDGRARFSLGALTEA